MLQLSLDGATPPARQYSAGQFGCLVKDDYVDLIFAQLGLVGGVRNLLAVRMFSDAVIRLCESTREYLPQLQAFVSQHEIVAARSVLPESDPPHFVSVTASIAQIGHTGREAEINFFRVSPRAIMQAGRNKDGQILIEPLVQVVLPTGMLLTALLALQEAKQNLPKEIT